jgi:hypothetical protein
MSSYVSDSGKRKKRKDKKKEKKKHPYKTGGRNRTSEKTKSNKKK